MAATITSRCSISLHINTPAHLPSCPPYPGVVKDPESDNMTNQQRA
jgi:hypothetical protein